MNPQIRELYRKTEGRYIDDHEAAALQTYADNLLERIEIVKAIERAESTIIDETIALVRLHHKNLPDENGPMAMDLARRDFSIFLRYAAASMLMMNPNFIYDKLVVWYRTIIFALVRPEAIVFGFKKLIESTRKNLPADHAALVVPYLQLVIDEFESNLRKQAA